MRELMTTRNPNVSTVWYPTSARTRSLSCSSSRGNFKDPTPFSFTKSEFGYCQGTTGMYGPGWSITTDGYGPGDQVYSGTAFYAAALDPYNKCLDKLYASMRNDIDLSIDIYQGRQTVKMVMDFYSAIRHPIDTFLGAGKKLIRDQKMVRSTKLAGSKWLEFQYGLRPTMNTIHTLTSGLAEHLSSPNGFQLAKARASSKDKSVKTFKTSGNHWVQNIPAVITSTDSRRCEVALIYTIGNAELNALSQFSSLNPVSFLYENIPFSFVLDWAIDVGGYIRMMETALATGLVFKSGYKTVTRERTASVTCKGSYREYGTTHTADLKGSCFERSLSRTVLSSMPLPVLPSFNPKLGSERLLSAASLLSNFLTIQPSKRR